MNVSRVLSKKSLIVFSVFGTLVSYSVSAEEPTVVPAGQFPNAALGQYMQPNYIYENAAVAANMLGLTEGEIVAEAVYVTVSCPENQYLTDNNTCVDCPSTYPNSIGAEGGIAKCYKIVTRGCSQNACECSDNSTCTCDACSCDGGTYVEYSDGTTSGTTENETCNQTVSGTTCVAGYYMKEGVCTACAKGTYKAEAGNATSCTVASEGYYVSTTGATVQTQCPSGYRDGSNNGRDDITDCYKTVIRGCTKNACDCPEDSVCTCNDCACVGETYKRHVDFNGLSDGFAEGTTENETCNQTVSGTTCVAGYYMKEGVCTACAKGTYKAEAGNATSCTVASEGYYVATTGATAQTKCGTGLVSPEGTTSAGGCGKVMYVDNTKLYLTKTKQTSPALAARIDGVVYYAKTTPVSSGTKPMNANTTKSLRTKIDGIEYSIHDNTVQGE